jgi:hypothetical protein
LLAIFPDNRVMFAVPHEQLSSSINWSEMFSLPGDYNIRAAVISSESTVEIELLFMWRMNRATAEITWLNQFAA